MEIYIDTSVIGGLFDDEFKLWSEKLFDEFISGEKTAVISDTTLEELSFAPGHIRNSLKKIPDNFIKYVLLNDEAEDLSYKYIKEKIVTEKSLLDARHIAIATVNKVDILVSWNFKHIVNYKLIRLYNSVNLKYGYNILEIRNPREVLNV
ncbi:MAG: PIN domain-containing protein [Ignavibacteria bacterium]|nr:PIN domain-containing protein [Ignavibacteria bacterium]